MVRTISALSFHQGRLKACGAFSLSQMNQLIVPNGIAVRDHHVVRPLFEGSPERNRSSSALLKSKWRIGAVRFNSPRLSNRFTVSTDKPPRYWEASFSLKAPRSSRRTIRFGFVVFGLINQPIALKQSLNGVGMEMHKVSLKPPSYGASRWAIPGERCQPTRIVPVSR